MVDIFNLFGQGEYIKTDKNIMEFSRSVEKQIEELESLLKFINWVGHLLCI